MKRPSALVVLLGILGVVTSVSGSVPHKILKRNEEKFRGNITGRCLEPPVDLTSAGYFTKSCYKSDQRTALIEDCLQLKENIKNNQELIECGPVIFFLNKSSAKAATNLCLIKVAQYSSW
ncbi:hypothetical protein PPACK8108_LOCUS16642 [Phakopsora pachyrhizi]|uniref:Secreted protein n=1 Tax=Phakopsora pachyrhizi TaxID=170000 RepID=A0AAV0BBR6_PHAPC|nr:hypothetical protein PPACK8108_LOCUS16642 [Phakopsora pachyrhizi]